MHGYMVHGRGNSHKGEESNGSDVVGNSMSTPTIIDSGNDPLPAACGVVENTQRLAPLWCWRWGQLAHPEPEAGKPSKPPLHTILRRASRGE